jgi:2-polyprenyl-3-methyl-5-hydroxy-6-metoxy-1,4-benzoquinol methylase
MSLIDNKVDINDKEIFEKYHDTIYEEKHEWRDYELTSAGFGEWYYNCLPTDKRARILDIGCGDGKFLFFLQRKGYTRIEGLELSSRQAEEARKHVECPIHVVDDTLAFLRKHSSIYQTITMNDVLEHVPKNETVSLLRGILMALQPNGCVVVNVPQVSGFTSVFCRYNDFTHETLFTEMSLKQVLLLAGFSDIRFISQKWPLKWTPRHLAFRLVRLLWYGILKLIYTIESPGEKHPRSFQVRLVASANRPHL